MRPRRSLFLVNTALAAGILFWVLDLSRSGRTAIDWMVITLVSGGILWNLFRLARRLHQHGGPRALWPLQRTLLFGVIGFLNTVLIRPEDEGTWKHWLGLLLVLGAFIGTVELFIRERRIVAKGS